MKMYWFIFAVLGLIFAKLIDIFHIHSNQYGYVDIDRLIALLFFITVYLQIKTQPIDIKAYQWLLLYLLLTFLFGLLLEISLVKVALLLLLTALVEEILLRGVLYEWMLLKFSAVFTLISSSVFFALVHPAVYSDWLYGIAVIITGMVLGGVYLHYREQSKELAVVHATGLHMAIILLAIKIGWI